jgi:hypothetical protein
MSQLFVRCIWFILRFFPKRRARRPVAEWTTSVRVDDATGNRLLSIKVETLQDATIMILYLQELYGIDALCVSAPLSQEHPAHVTGLAAPAELRGVAYVYATAPSFVP